MSQSPPPPSLQQEEEDSTFTNGEQAPSTPPPPPPPPPDQASLSSDSLEDRVLELELKLATLSRLLQQSQKSPRPISPLVVVERTYERSTTPYLESPCPSRQHSKSDLTLTFEQEASKPSTPPPLLPQQPPSPPPPKSIQQKWMDYLNTFQESTHDVDVQMQEFIRVPSQLEYLLGYGFLVCVDCFLYILTILPIRFVWSCVLLLKTFSNKNQDAKFHRRHLYQLIQVGIIYVVYYFLLIPISIGKLYHWIRGQAMLKLYVLIAIVEVFDRLMCSLGQDCLDSMYWNTTRRPRSLRMLISVVVVLVYAGVHTLILFVHVATLNVAMNSADQALLTLLISGNFAEIKSTVFKKYNKPNLFKITASDICERFKLALFLSLVLVLNASQGMSWLQILSYCQMCGIVWCTEMLADWIKHSFITKFNFIQSDIYGEYALLLAGDVTGIGHEGVNLDHSHAVVKRIGLAQVPLVCVLGRFMTEAARYSLWTRQKLALCIVGTWCVLLVLKIGLGRYLQVVSQRKLQNAPELKTPAKKKKE